MLPLLANPTIADVRHNADDFDIGPGIRAGPVSDARAERVAASEVSLHKGLVDYSNGPPTLAHRQRVALIEVSSRDDSGPEGREEFRADRIQMDLAIRGDSLPGVNREEVIPASTGQYLDTRNSRCLSTTRSTDFIMNPANEPGCFRWGVAVSKRIDAERDQAGCIKARTFCD